MARVQREKLGDFDALLAKMKPDTKLASLAELRPALAAAFYFWPYIFAGADITG